MYADKAEALFHQGFNCAQAVFGAYCEASGGDLDGALRAASSLGGGLGNAEEVCGAALGLCLALGLEKGYATPDEGAKAAHRNRVRRAMADFREAFGQTSCRALRKGGDRAACARYVRYAADWLEQALTKE